MGVDANGLPVCVRCGKTTRLMFRRRRSLPDFTPVSVWSCSDCEKGRGFRTSVGESVEVDRRVGERRNAAQVSPPKRHTMKIVLDGVEIGTFMTPGEGTDAR